MDRHVAFERLCNFRDVGGYATADGRRVAYGRLYRSDSLGKLDGADWDRFLALGVRTVVDLRYPWEIERQGRVREHDGIGYHNVCIEHRPYDQEALAADVAVGPYLAERYAEIAEDGVAELAEALRVVAHEPGPVVVHCAGGKDRTGQVVALVLGLVGVGEDDIVADYALTGRATAAYLADFRERHGRPPRWPGYGQAPPEVMRRFLDHLSARYGSPREYAATRLGVDDALVAALRDRLLD